MNTAFTGGGDLRRSLELLWGRQEPGRRGPKPRLTTDEVVAAAIAIADAEGLAALSMRRVAEAVGVSPMSLYTYVPSKSELVDLMFDRAMAGVDDPDEATGGWREKLAFIARQRWAIAERHPWFLDLALHRPPLGPNVLRKAEVALRIFEGMGLDPDETHMAGEALQNYVNGALQSAREAQAAERESGLTDAEWLAMVEPLLKPHFDPTAYPTLARMAASRRPKPRTLTERTAAFEFGLERLLDGLAGFIAAHKPAPANPPPRCG